MSRLIRINPRDNVAVALEPLKSGESALGVTLREDIPAEIPEFIEEAPEQGERKIVRTKTYTTRPMHVEDAILQMELLGHSFFVFINIETEQTNVLYLRKDGNLGLLEPEY